MRAILGFICAAAMAAEPGWISLSDGKTLKGWKAEGNASWSVDDGAIVGRQGPAGAAGDLFTEAKWADFELEAEWMMRWPGNSGFWFRVNGPKSGYQADILEERAYPDALSGSLYCMGKAFIAKNGDASTVNKNGWNRLRILAQGDHFVIEQNGKKVVDTRDATWPDAGRVGIQVHPGAAFSGMEIRARNIRLRPLDK